MSLAKLVGLDMDFLLEKRKKNFVGLTGSNDGVFNFLVGIVRGLFREKRIPFLPSLSSSTIVFHGLLVVC